MWVLLVSLWYLIGIGLFLYLMLIEFNEIKISDIFISLIVGLAGPLIFILFIDKIDYIIYRKNKNST